MDTGSVFLTAAGSAERRKNYDFAGHGRDAKTHTVLSENASFVWFCRTARGTAPQRRAADIDLTVPRGLIIAPAHSHIVVRRRWTQLTYADLSQD